MATAVEPRIRMVKRTLGSLLLGALGIASAILVFRQGLLPAMTAVLDPSPAWLSATRRAGMLLATVAAYWAYVRWCEGRAATELRLHPFATALCAVIGTAMAALPISAMFALGVYESVQLRGPSVALVDVAVVIGIAATLEELLFRCLLFRVIERDWSTRMALTVQAVVFAVFHVANVWYGSAADVLMTLVSVTLLGLLWAAMFVITRNLWTVAAHHAAWNFTILSSGLPLSGMENWRPVAPIAARYVASDWLTGGMFGPENSPLVLITIAISVAVLLRVIFRGTLAPCEALLAGMTRLGEKSPVGWRGRSLRKTIAGARRGVRRR